MTMNSTLTLQSATRYHERATRMLLDEAAQAERAGEHAKASAAGQEAAAHLARAIDCALAATVLFA